MGVSLKFWQRSSTSLEQRDAYPLPFSDWLGYFTFNGVGYGYPLSFAQTLTGDHEKPLPQDYTGLVTLAYRANAIIYALSAIRMHHFAQARFQFRQLRGGRPGNLFGTPALALLETPWPNGTTTDLLSRMLQDVDLAGNAYVVKQGDRLVRLRPDWVTILLGSRTKREEWVAGDPDTEVAGYIYKPGGAAGKSPEVIYPPGQVAHFAPTPDPFAYYRGMSWLTPVLREVLADQAMTTHKQKFLDQGATVNMVVKFPTDNLTLFEEAVKKFQEGHTGLGNAYKTLFLAAGMDATPVGANLQQMDFAVVQRAGETRLAAAAGVPVVIAGFSEGLQGAMLNAGNYATAYRRFADGTMRPLWRQVAGALAPLITVPDGAQLWYDDRDIQFLQQDAKDAAEVLQLHATTINTLTLAGFPADSIIDAVVSNDLNRLSGTHSGLTSVQLHPASKGTQNGSGDSANIPAPLTLGGKYDN